MMASHAKNRTLRTHFLTQQALSAILLSQSSVALCKIYEVGMPAWWKMHGRCCTEPNNGNRETTMYAKRVCNTATLGYESPALGRVVRIRKHMKLAPTSGDHQKETRMNSIITQPKASLPSHVVTGSDVVSGLATEQVLTHQKRFLVGSHEGVELQTTIWLNSCVPYHFVYHHIPMSIMVTILLHCLLALLVTHQNEG